jgi:hypothetical protein
MRPTSTTQPFSCVTCEVPIGGAPTFHLGLPFCCAGCAADGPCICSYDREPAGASRVRHCLDVADPVAVPKPAPKSAVAAARR